MDTPDNPYKQKVFEHWDLLNKLARKHFFDPIVAEEAVSYVLEQLAKDDWSRARRHQGRASFKTYLNEVVYRLLEDFARHKFGRHRTPTWIREQGALWIWVYDLLCRQRQSAPAVIELAYKAPTGERDPAVLRRIIAAIRGQIINCGAPTAEAIERPFFDYGERFDPEVLGPDGSGQGPSVEALEIAEQEVCLLKLVAEWMQSAGAAGEATTYPIHSQVLVAALRRLQDILVLEPEDRLLLRLIYQEGMMAAAAGEQLGLNVNQTHGRRQRLEKRIRKALQEAGLDRPLRELLEDVEI